MYVKTDELAVVIEEWIDRYEGAHGKKWSKFKDPKSMTMSGKEYVAKRSDVNPRTVTRILTRHSKVIDVSAADKILCALGLQHEFNIRVPIHYGNARAAHTYGAL